MTKREHYLFVCQNERPDGTSRPSCGKSGSPEVYLALKAELVRRGLAKSVVRACTCSCLDMCDEGPVIGVQPENIFYGHMTVERVPLVVQALIEGSVVQQFLVQSASSMDPNKDR